MRKNKKGIKTKSLVSLMIVICFIIGCSEIIDKPHEIVAGCVHIQYQNRFDYVYIGTLNHEMIGWDESIWQKEPSIWIFRELPKDFEDKGLKKGGAYLAKDDFEFLGYVDLSQTDEELAKLFHIDLEKLVNQNPKIENDADLILVQDGEMWQEHGKFVYKDSRLDSSITK